MDTITKHGKIPKTSNWCDKKDMDGEGEIAAIPHAFIVFIKATVCWTCEVLRARFEIPTGGLVMNIN